MEGFVGSYHNMGGTHDTGVCKMTLEGHHRAGRTVLLGRVSSAGIVPIKDTRPPVRGRTLSRGRTELLVLLCFSTRQRLAVWRAS